MKRGYFESCPVVGGSVWALLCHEVARCTAGRIRDDGLPSWCRVTSRRTEGALLVTARSQALGQRLHGAPHPGDVRGMMGTENVRAASA